MSEAGQGKKLRTVLTSPRAQWMSDSEFQLFNELIHQTCGISFGSEKRALLESRLARRMEKAGFHNVMQYYQAVRNPKSGADEMFYLLDELLIGETSFFRNAPQFELFSNVVLPELMARPEKENSRSLRIWSAGCSTGQEPYTIAMTALERFPQLASWAFQIFASDLSFSALNRAQDGVYRVEQMKGVSDALRRKFFRQKEDAYVVSEALQRPMIFDYHNLKHDHGLKGLDVIFCRNVLIYFTREEYERLINRFATCLVPGGYLFLGHAESLQGISTRFSMVHKNKGIAWQLER